jgi:hypothetical protein
MKEVLMIKCEDMNEYMKSMTTKMTDKFDKYWGDNNLLMSISIVLDPRYKMKLVNFCFSIMHPLSAARNHINNVLAVLKELFESYVFAHMTCILQETTQVNAVFSSSLNAIVRNVVLKMGQGRSRYIEHVRSSDIICPLKQIWIFILKECLH